ncbi:uncharacterized protein LOC135201938 [Macrobrachium nipponense]|uniref:uncharacterized protein LOC135201938 n=1 Tax=Macrobrachium nipponense TaxID=159736 RepID=UPI0030C7A760
MHDSIRCAKFHGRLTSRSAHCLIFCLFSDVIRGSNQTKRYAIRRLSKASAALAARQSWTALPGFKDTASRVGHRMLQNITALRVIQRCLTVERLKNHYLCGPNWWRRQGRRTLSGSCSHQQLVFPSQFSDVQQPRGNLVNKIFENVDRWGSQVAVECSESGRTRTYNQLLDATRIWAGFLSILGLEKGDVIAIVLPNCPEYPILVLGANSLGVIVTMMNPKNTKDEITNQLKVSGAKLLVVTPSLVEEVVHLLSSNPPVQLVFNGPCNIPGTYSLQDILADPSGTRIDPIELTESTISLLPFSSGTTGPPKGVQVSHGAIAINLRMISHPSITATKLATDPFQEPYMCVLPFYHMFGMLLMMFGIQHGVKLVTFPSFQPGQFVSTLGKHRVRTLHLVPPLVSFLIQSPDITAESPDVSQKDYNQCNSVFLVACPSMQEQIQRRRFSTVESGSCL